jgi:hypothetical protein
MLPISSCIVDQSDQGPAVVFARQFLHRFNNRDWVANDLGTVLAPCFVRHDHRHVASEPAANRDEWISQQSMLTELAPQWPTYTYEETLGVRGSRLVAYRTSIELSDTDELAFIMIIQCDEDLEQVEFASLHDAEAAKAAFDELDRLHAALSTSS